MANEMTARHRAHLLPANEVALVSWPAAMSRSCRRRREGRRRMRRRRRAYHHVEAASRGEMRRSGEIVIATRNIGDGES